MPPRSLSLERPTMPPSPISALPAGELREFVEQEYLPRKLSLKPDSIKSIRYTINRWSEAAKRPVTLADLAPPYDAVHAFMAQLLADGLRPTSINVHWRNLRALSRELHRRKRVRRRKALWPPAMKVLKHVPEAWTDAQCARLLVECRRQQRLVKGQVPQSVLLLAFVLLVYASGGRFGAVYALRRRDVDLETGSAHFRAEDAKDSEAGVRWLTDEALAAVRALLACHTPADDEPIFALVSESWLLRLLRRMVDAAGLPSVRHRRDLTHKLRRTHLSYIGARDLDLARRQAGHSTAELTLKHYIDPRIAPDRTAVGLLPNIDGPAAPPPPDPEPPAAQQTLLRLFAG